MPASRSLWTRNSSIERHGWWRSSRFPGWSWRWPERTIVAASPVVHRWSRSTDRPSPTKPSRRCNDPAEQRFPSNLNVKPEDVIADQHYLAKAGHYLELSAVAALTALRILHAQKTFQLRHA